MKTRLTPSGRTSAEACADSEGHPTRGARIGARHVVPPSADTRIHAWLCGRK
jgi:hypothetical protein